MTLLWLIPTLPFIGAFVLVLFGSQLPKRMVPVVGAGSVGLAALITLYIAGYFITSRSKSFDVTAWQWLDVGGLSAGFTFHLDALSLVFIFVITFVGFLIHIYSAEFMVDDDGYA